MSFLIILALTTLSIATAAAYFSIYGLAQIFAGAFWPVVIMASTLEAGKLVTASYLYRYWDTINWWMRSYMLSAVLLLMLITSAGIFGFLTAAHQQGMSNLQTSATKIELLEQQKEQAQQLKDERLQRRAQIDKQVADLPPDFIRGRQRLSNQYQAERSKIQAEIDRYTAEIESKTKEIAELKLTQIEQEAHVGPILYVAKALGRGTEDAIIWMTYLIMFVFDPLAVALTVGFNIALKKRREEKEHLNRQVLVQSAGAPQPDTPTKPQPGAFIQDVEDEPTPSITSVDNLVTEPDWPEQPGQGVINLMDDATPDETRETLDIIEDEGNARSTSHHPNIRRILKIDDKQKDG